MGVREHGLRGVLLGIMAGLGIAHPLIAEAAVPNSWDRLSRQEQGLLEEYRADYERLRQCYDNIRMEAVRRTSLITANQSEENPEGVRQIRLVYRANGGALYRMDGISLHFRDASPIGGTVIKLIRPEGYVVAERDGPDKPFVISEWTGDREQGLNSISACVFQWSPYTLHVFPMKWFVFGEPDWLKDYRLDKVVLHEEEGESLVTITAQGITTLRDKKWRGSFVYYRDRCWALRRFSSVVFARDRAFVEPDDYSESSIYEYEGSHEGVPLLKRLEHWREQGL